MWYACANKVCNVKVIQVLLHYGADVNIVNKKGMNLMHYLLNYNAPADTNIVKCLLRAGFNAPKLLTKDNYLKIQKEIKSVIMEE